MPIYMRYDMPCMDCYTEELVKIVTGEVIWWHQRCIVCKKLCRCITVLENYYFYLAISH
jgi:hypothetical protein